MDSKIEQLHHEMKATEAAQPAMLFFCLEEVHKDSPLFEPCTDMPASNDQLLGQNELSR